MDINSNLLIANMEINNSTFANNTNQIADLKNILNKGKATQILENQQTNPSTTLNNLSAFPKKKNEPTYDWLEHFLITDEMKPNTKLQTVFAHQLFDFLKSNLFNFIPGKEIKPATIN